MRDRYASVQIDVDAARPAERVAQRAAVEIESRPFHLLVVGDFSARGSRSEEGARTHLPPPIPIDRDDFDAVLARLNPRIRLRLEAGLPPIDIDIRELDDLHPDGLFANAALFARLRDLRRRVLDPRELGRVAEELGQGAAPPATPPPPVPPAATSGGALLDLVVAETAPAPEELSVEAVLDPQEQLGSLVRGLVRPHLVPRPDPRQADLLRSIDAAVTTAMRRILHHPDLQAAESLWRSVLLLVRSLETGTMLKVDLLDASDAELAEALERQEWSPRSSDPDVPPALLVALHPVEPDEGGIRRLRLLARAAATAGTACLSGIPPRLVGVPNAETLDQRESWSSPPEAWTELRSDPAAPHLAVALPRFLLRLPYGEDSDECESFDFEELDEAPATTDFLWGSSAIPGAILIGRAFSDQGWGMRTGAHREVDGLPLPILRTGGEVVARQTAEATLPDDAAEELLDRGVIPLMAMRDRGIVRVPRFQSIAEPPGPLAGPWSSI